MLTLICLCLLCTIVFTHCIVIHCVMIHCIVIRCNMPLQMDPMDESDADLVALSNYLDNIHEIKRKELEVVQRKRMSPFNQHL